MKNNIALFYEGDRANRNGAATFVEYVYYILGSYRFNVKVYMIKKIRKKVPLCVGSNVYLYMVKMEDVPVIVENNDCLITQLPVMKEENDQIRCYRKLLSAGI